MIRDKLQAGWGRKPISCIVGILAGLAMMLAWNKFLIHKTNPMDGLAKLAFVAAAFSVTAYNLRVRVIDLILKLEAADCRATGLCQIARSCGKKLTNLVVLFTFCACCMGAGGLIAIDAHTAKWVAVWNTFLFAFATIHFFYILFAFERLEGFILGDFAQKTNDKQIEKLFQPPTD